MVLVGREHRQMDVLLAVGPAFALLRIIRRQPHDAPLPIKQGVLILNAERFDTIFESESIGFEELIS